MSTLTTIKLGNLDVSRLIVGGNPFAGYSHQTMERNVAMSAWYTDERVVEVLFQAQELGLNACILRGDLPRVRILKRYWEQGGTMRWIAQTASEAKTPSAGVQFCLDHGAAACFIHGGLVDFLLAQGHYAALSAAIETAKAGGVPVGIAGHMPEDFTWAEENLALDFYMTCYYNPSPRQNVPHIDPTRAEQFLAEDREARVATIQQLKRPVIHYKILAAGRIPPAEAFAYAARHMRPGDAVCVGVYTADNPKMLQEDIALLTNSLAAVGQ